jgi:murein DD-endopeptidase MepM/ murein hydrolase activator NlpD
MSEKRLKRQQLKKKLFTKNRLVILNEDTFEEIFSLKLTLMNVFVVATLGAILIITVTTFIIAFTPLREFIPGYASSQLKNDAMELAIKSDSLVAALKKNEAYLSSIKKVLTNDLDIAKFNKDSILASENEMIPEVNLQPSKEELNLRKQVEKEDKYNLLERAESKENTEFFPPVKGTILKQFNLKKKQFYVDIALTKNTPIKAILNGTVVFADWTPENGNVIIIRHNNEFTSIYKQLGSLTKSQGDIVKTGEVVAIADFTNNQSSGIHLLFELWKKGIPINPSQYIEFE